MNNLGQELCLGFAAGVVRQIIFHSAIILINMLRAVVTHRARRARRTMFQNYSAATHQSAFAVGLRDFSVLDVQSEVINRIHGRGGQSTYCAIAAPV